MKILIIVQARSGSTRFPGKVLKTVFSKSLLELQLERIRSIRTSAEVVVATTYLPQDDKIDDICASANIPCFRGHPSDLLDRHYKAALKYGADAVVKIPSDCPLIDPEVIDRVLNYYIDNSDIYDFVSNLHPATYPDGNDVEIMPFRVLKNAWEHAEKAYELEHTTPFIWDNPDKFRIGNVEWETGLDFSMSHRFTIDYPEDFNFIEAVYKELYPSNPTFSLRDILNLLNQKPELMLINRKHNGVNWYRGYANELKTIGGNMAFYAY